MKSFLKLMDSLAKWLSVRLRTKWLRVHSSCSHLNFRYRACFKQGFPWHSGIQATLECGFTLKRVRDMIRTYS